MELSTKPDFNETRKAWNHYWNGELYLKRPLIVGACDKPGSTPLPEKENPFFEHYYRKLTRDWDNYLRDIDRWLECVEFPCETIPFFAPDFGPDQFAAFCGASIKYDPHSPGTNWVEPIVKDWSDFHLHIDPNNIYWKNILELSRKMAIHSRGRYLVGVCDIHGNADVLSALRSPEKLCLDFYDNPTLVAERMREARRLFPVVYDGLYQAGGMNTDTGSLGWIPFWCEGKFASIQCDFICMVSPEIGRKYIIPALAEEASFLDHCAYHLDGPGALPHLDDILAIKDIDVIQWVSGAGQKPMWEWLDVLKKCQAARKGLQIYGIPIEQIKALHKELDPTGIVYCVWGYSRDEILGLADWLVKNT